MSEKLDNDLTPFTFNMKQRVAKLLKSEAARRGVRQKDLIHLGLRAIGLEIHDDEFRGAAWPPPKGY